MRRFAYIVIGCLWCVAIVLRWLVSIYVSVRDLRELTKLDQDP
jgi:hypothetical protein